MSRTIVICGYGPGISDAVARRFGEEGFSVAIVARNEERLFAAAKALGAAGVTVKAYPTDLADAGAVRAMITSARKDLGTISTIHYNAYGGGGGDLLTATAAEVRAVVDVAVGGLIAAVQEALPDLKEAKGSVLVTGGGFAFYDATVDQMAVQFQAMGLAIGKAAQHKATALLHHRLKSEGVFVGEVVVLGMVKGTAFDSGHATLEASDIAAKLWEIHQGRSEATVNFP